MEYDFEVLPGANPDAIWMEFEGATKIQIDSKGDLLLHTPGSVLRQRRPHAYQKRGMERREIGSRYVFREGDRLAFQLDEYDAGRPLVIDPLLIYSSYLGGSTETVACSVSVDSAGNAYFTGFTSSADFPTLNFFQANTGGQRDIFVSKVDPTGSTILFSTYLGGASDDVGFDIATDAAGNSYVTGRTESSNFPTMNSLQPALGGMRDAFVIKLNPTGSTLIFSTYLGAGDSDSGHRLAVDAVGNTYVTGSTYSSDFPTTIGAFRTTKQGAADVFVTKLNSSASALVFSTYLGGSDEDNVFPLFIVNGGDIAVDSTGHAYVIGATNSSDFPTLNPVQATFGGITDAFVAKLNPAGSGLIYSTYLGGSLSDHGLGIAVDATGNAYLAGRTGSVDFPTANALQPVLGEGGEDAFIAKLDAAGNFLFSTYLGGSGGERCNGIVLDPSGNIYLTGGTRSTNFPTTTGAIQASGGGLFYDVFITRLNAQGSTILYSTYLGGNDNDAGIGITVDAHSNVYVAGYTSSSDFPTANPFQASLAGKPSALIAKLETISPVLEIELGKPVYTNGETVTTKECRLKNPRSVAATVELKVWLHFPGMAPFCFVNLGADGSFVLPPGLDQNFGPVTLMTVTPSLTRGAYELSSRMVDPVTGRLISQDLNSFQFQ